MKDGWQMVTMGEKDPHWKQVLVKCGRETMADGDTLLSAEEHSDDEFHEVCSVTCKTMGLAINTG